MESGDSARGRLRRAAGGRGAGDGRDAQDYQFGCVMDYYQLTCVINCRPTQTEGRLTEESITSYPV